MVGHACGANMVVGHPGVSAMDITHIDQRICGEFAMSAKGLAARGETGAAGLPP